MWGEWLWHCSSRGMNVFRRFRLSLLPVLALAGLATASAVSVGCFEGSREEQGLSEDRFTGGRYGYGYGDDYGYGDYGYGYGQYGRRY